MRLVDADKIIEKVGEVLNKGVYKTMVIELIQNAPTEDVFTTDDGMVWHSECNQYVCQYCKYSGSDRCWKCFALPDGTMRKFSAK